MANCMLPLTTTFRSGTSQTNSSSPAYIGGGIVMLMGRTVYRYALATAAAWTMWVFVAQLATIRGGSMYPTVQEGDRVIVWKLVASRIGGWGRQPGRHDIVQFRRPNRPDEFLVKRIIGVPGDHL